MKGLRPILGLKSLSRLRGQSQRRFLNLLVSGLGAACIAPLFAAPQPAQAQTDTDDLVATNSAAVGKTCVALAGVKLEVVGNTYINNGYLVVQRNATGATVAFRVRASSADVDTRFVVCGDGRVGVGTSSPQSALHVASGGFQIGGKVVADDEGTYYCHYS